ncbi:hypothetical protein [Rosenbergiella epipactidis]|uniref:hypothetical protein n=1 Tax=Rosenbergiella epipactidis TaxID=1544694 RepID=UPI001F4DF837|nr:hypothetical protein [Rosenbergiella epipactidis]
MALFTGSGSGIAAQNWINSQCSRLAINESKLHDPYTGGEVRYVDFTSGQCSLEDTVFLSTMLIKLYYRGGL